jgi:hypothetical protein
MDETYVSPAIIVDLFNEERKQVGGIILSDRKYQKLREGWVAACHSMARSRYLNEGVRWLRPNPVAHSMPDFYSFVTKDIPGEDYKEGVNQDIEVFEKRDTQKTLSEAITAKVKRWDTPLTSLVCYSWVPLSMVHLARAHRDIEKLQPKVLEIWVLAELGKRGDLTSVQIYPNFFAMKVPKSIPNNYYEPFGFVAKKRARVNSPGGVYKINDQMIISKISE